MGKMNLETTPYSICSENRDLEQVFKKYGVPATSKRRLSELFGSPEFILAVLDAVENPLQLSRARFVQFGTPAIVEYLERTHNFYLETWVPEITHLLQHVVGLLGNEHPMMNALPAFWRSYRFELQRHFDMEEKGLFPYARLIHKHARAKSYLRVYTDEMKGYSLSEFVHDHIDESIELAEIRTLIHKYGDRSNVGLPYRILIHKMRLFEQDMLVHAFLEDEVLVPRLRLYEHELLQSLN